MKNFLSKNMMVVIAFILPIALIIVVALSVYIPSLMVHTNYNFVYITCGESTGYYYGCTDYLVKKYSVVNGKLAISDVSNVSQVNTGVKNGTYSARIFIHDTKKNESREITEQEALSLNLNNLLTSPDGVAVSNEYNQGEYFFPFGGSSSSYGYYLKKGSGKQKLNLINSSDRYYYQNNFQFIGWVL